MINVLVTGANGQLGQCIKDIEKKHANLNFIFTDYQDLDIYNQDEVNGFFQMNKPIHYCVNCAAYTAVDKAEEEKEKAHKINVLGSKFLALACQETNTTMIHISTDFVFDGNKVEPYTERDKTNPISIYGETKLKGEKEIKKILHQHFIIRTSWLYSEHGNNFMKTMLRLAKDRDQLRVVSDQIGTPTYAGDLAQVILNIINTKSQNFGIFHYSNEGVASWYDFAKAIFEESEIDIELIPIKTIDYLTLAMRPKFSVLDKTKIKDVFGTDISFWRDSLKKVVTKT